VDDCNEMELGSVDLDEELKKHGDTVEDPKV
jgi:hypothetical protein